ncbi:uncharacterized protein DS421_3g86180 [Arachis hypogaea]|nr:uncharacterized protein DS421_3g86180 [Arachis hypogaea]
MNILPWEVVVKGRIHLVVENFHILGVVHLGNNMEGVALENVDVGMVVALCVVHIAHMVVGRMDMD